MFFQKLTRAEDRYREIEQLITLPEVVSDNKEYSKIMKEYRSEGKCQSNHKENKVSLKSYLHKAQISPS